ncbi:MAG: hypothetical protein H7Y88_03495 [Phycisphaerales bacterium]|nr:hypothetical protein [Phycisphaerales bacterium]
MSNRSRAWMMLATAGLAAPAFGQDSVSPFQGVAGSDAVWVWDTGEQCNAFVVDLEPVGTNWGSTFGIAPIYKSSRVQPNFPSALISNHSLSNIRREGVPFPVANYALWNGPGFGINNIVNMETATTSPGGPSFQLGIGMNEFAGQHNGVVAGFINYSMQNPARLFVTRTNAAANATAVMNSPIDYTANPFFSQFGGALPDASGNVYFRADSFGAINQPGRLTGANIFRIDYGSRNCGALNVITDAGGSDVPATDWVLVRNTEYGGAAWNLPTALPEELPSATRPVYLGTNFGTQYAYESAPLILTRNTLHRPGTEDHRGNPTYTHVDFFGGTAGTMGILTRPTPPLPMRTRGISLWGVDTDGNIAGTLLLQRPTMLMDAVSGFMVMEGTPGVTPGLGEFMNYRDQTSARGGAPVAIGRDQQGRLLVAAVVADSLTSTFGSNGTEHNAQDPSNYLAVARLENPAATPQWGLAAYVDIAANGKMIQDAAGVREGQLVPLGLVGGAPLGPSISSPAIDSVGNVWFLAAYQNQDPDGNPEGNPTTGLFRAVYDGSDALAPKYRLEQVLSNGQEIHSPNTGLNYKIIFLSIADNNSIDSGSLFAHNINQLPYGPLALVSVDTADPRTLGGLVIQATIIYDVNNDGQFVKLSGAGGDPNSADQDYNVLLFVGGAFGGEPPVDCNLNGVPDADDIGGNPALDCFDRDAAPVGGFNTRGGPNGVPDACECAADWDRNGTVGSADITSFLASWFNDLQTGQTKADFNCSGTTGSADITAFLNIWFQNLAGNPPFSGCGE